MRDSTRKLITEAVASAREHKRMFWKYLDQYEDARKPHQKDWLLEHIMAHRRMMKLQMQYAKEWAGKVSPQ